MIYIIDRTTVQKRTDFKPLTVKIGGENHEKEADRARLGSRRNDCDDGLRGDGTAVREGQPRRRVQIRRWLQSLLAAAATYGRPLGLAARPTAR